MAPNPNGGPDVTTWTQLEEDGSCWTYPLPKWPELGPKILLSAAELRRMMMAHITHTYGPHDDEEQKPGWTIQPPEKEHE